MADSSFSSKADKQRSSGGFADLTSAVNLTGFFNPNPKKRRPSKKELWREIIRDGLDLVKDILVAAAKDDLEQRELANKVLVENEQPPVKKLRRSEEIRFRCAEMAKSQWEQTGEVDWKPIYRAAKELRLPHFKTLRAFKTSIRQSVYKILKKHWNIQLSKK